MKRFSKTMWSAVAVLGLYTPVSVFAGFGGQGSKMVGSMGGSSSQNNHNNSSSNVTVRKLPTNTGIVPPVLINQGNNTVKTKPILTLPGNSLPTGNGTVKKFPGNIGTLPTFPVLDPGLGTKGPKKPPILDPGHIPPIVVDPGPKGPKKPPIFDPGHIPPIVVDPGNGGGNNPPGGGNNPPGGGNNPPGGGNGNGNGGCVPGGGKHCWPNYCLNWWWPVYYTQPYCGTVYVNGCWTHCRQPVMASQISLMTFGDTLPEIPSNATFRMNVSGLGMNKGLAAVEINGVGMQAELLEWTADSVVVRLPAVGLTSAALSELHILQSDGSMAKSLKFKMTPAVETSVATIN